MRTKADTAAIVQALKQEYPDPRCGLDHVDAWQLLVAVRLSAQCTDKRVNLITPALFAAYPTPRAMAQAKLEDLEEQIKTCGFYHSKAKDILLCAQKLVADFDGEVPQDMDTLLTLPGVGRKSANLIMGDVWGQPAIVADTHCIRLSNRLGFLSADDPVKVEFALKKVVDPAESNDFCHRLVLHGRAVCTARKANCAGCCLQSLCRTGRKTLPKEAGTAAAEPTKAGEKTTEPILAAESSTIK